jgi:hypothetical protein
LREPEPYTGCSASKEEEEDTNGKATELNYVWGRYNEMDTDNQTHIYPLNPLRFPFLLNFALCCSFLHYPLLTFLFDSRFSVKYLFFPLTCLCIVLGDALIFRTNCKNNIKTVSTATPTQTRFYAALFGYKLLKIIKYEERIA